MKLEQRLELVKIVIKIIAIVLLFCAYAGIAVAIFTAYIAVEYWRWNIKFKRDMEEFNQDMLF